MEGAQKMFNLFFILTIFILLLFTENGLSEDSPTSEATTFVS